MLAEETALSLKETKNLLAFSGGVDSTALFHLLIDNNVAFDMAIVYYGIRSQAANEVEFAKRLAKEYDKELFLLDASYLKDESNFEHKARNARYDFFNEIISTNGYETLLTGHQLNDRVEWLLMQLTRGAGVLELFSFDEWTHRDNYKVCRPMLNISKDELTAYLGDKEFYVDESNFDMKYTRNKFRKEYSDSLVKNYTEGLKRSFKYVDNDKKRLTPTIEVVCDRGIYSFVTDNVVDARRSLSGILKTHFGTVITTSQFNNVVSHNKISLRNCVIVLIDNIYYVGPKYVSDTVLSKEQKEYFRKEKLPKEFRQFIADKHL